MTPANGGRMPIDPETAVFSSNPIVNDAVRDIYAMRGMRDGDPEGYMGASIASAIERAIRDSSRALVVDHREARAE
jgi:hypothetical protein